MGINWNGQMQLQDDIPINATERSASRKFDRGDVAIVASIRAFGGIKNQVKIVDLSMTGFRMECLTHIPDYHAIFLTIPSFQQLEARIAWHTEWVYGCAFAHPLHTAVYDHIVRTHPSIAKPPSDTEGLFNGAPARLQRDHRARPLCDY